MKQKAVKIVGVKSDGTFWSYCSGPQEGAVRYEIGKEVFPETGCGPLACFTSLQHALEFFRADFCRGSIALCPWNNYKVFWCEIEPLEVTELWFGEEDFKRWNIENIPGAVTSWSVKLLDEVPVDLQYFKKLVGEI